MYNVHGKQTKLPKSFGSPADHCRLKLFGPGSSPRRSGRIQSQNSWISLNSGRARASVVNVTCLENISTRSTQLTLGLRSNEVITTGRSGSNRDFSFCLMKSERPEGTSSMSLKQLHELFWYIYFVLSNLLVGRHVPFRLCSVVFFQFQVISQHIFSCHLMSFDIS